MSPNKPLPQKQEPFNVHYKRVADFLQTLQEAGVHTVHIEALQRHLRASEVWGVLLTARIADEIHSAWVVAYHAMAPSPRQRAHALQEQAHVLAQVRQLVTQHGLSTRPGFYAVPEVFAFQYAAALPQDQESAMPEGGHA